jgi:hypothetical protein
MTRFMNILASVALATALTPIAANAATMTSLDYVHIAAHKAISAPLLEVQHVSPCTAAAAQQTTNDAVVTSGGLGNQRDAIVTSDRWGNQRYPESFGG